MDVMSKEIRLEMLIELDKKNTPDVIEVVEPELSNGSNLESPSRDTINQIKRDGFVPTILALL
jgi:hypothetical protein